MTLPTTKMVTLLLAVAAFAISPARAYCYTDSFGYYQCNSDLSYVARILIGLGVLAVCLAIIGGVFVRRRRTLAYRQNVAYLQNQPQAGQFPPPPPGAWGPPAPGGPSQYPSYPPKTEYTQNQPVYPGGFNVQPQEPPKTYDPNQPAYTPYGAGPPGYFPSPSGPPPPTFNYETRPDQTTAPYKV